MELEDKLLLDLVDNFVDGKDCSLAAANKIEVAIDDKFPEDDFMQYTVLMLAQYCPGGGEYLYDEEILKRRLIAVRKRLE